MDGVRAALIGRLSAAGCVAADEEADELLAAAGDAGTLDALVRRRERGEPLAWVVGTAPFCGHRIVVDAGVYVPRRQSEALARRAGRLLAARGDGGRAVDLCTGSGAVAVHLMAEVPSALVVAVDLDAGAVACARRNGVLALVGDLGEPLRAGCFDVVTAIAPYVPTRELRNLPSDSVDHEPRAALDGGAEGLDTVRSVVHSAARLLSREGSLLLELGGDQDRRIAGLLEACGFTQAEAWHDEDGDLRGLAAWRA